MENNSNTSNHATTKLARKEPKKKARSAMARHPVDELSPLSAKKFLKDIIIDFDSGYKLLKQLQRDLHQSLNQAEVSELCF